MPHNKEDPSEQIEFSQNKNVKMDVIKLGRIK